MPTPQALLDELCLAFPTLRHMLEAEQAWESALSDTWAQLLAAAHCMCHPTHLATPDRLLSAGHVTLPCVADHGDCLY
jgi:hypothetical protein